MQGTCLCGNVTLRTDDTKSIDACHCGMGRKWGGGPLLAVHCGSLVQVEGKASVRAFRCPEWAERAFCEQCGTHLYYHLIPGDQYMVPAGFFDQGTPFTFDEETFIDKKPDYYAFANDTRKLTEAEFLAKYAGDS